MSNLSLTLMFCPVIFTSHWGEFLFMHFILTVLKDFYILHSFKNASTRRVHQGQHINSDVCVWGRVTSDGKNPTLLHTVWCSFDEYTESSFGWKTVLLRTDNMSLETPLCLLAAVWEQWYTVYCWPQIKTSSSDSSSGKSLYTQTTPTANRILRHNNIAK